MEESLLIKKISQSVTKLYSEVMSFTLEEAVITGIVASPLHYNNVKIEQDRGNTSVGAGTITYYAYMTKEAFDRDVFFGYLHYGPRRKRSGNRIRSL